jgi:hypothetical protein
MRIEHVDLDDDLVAAADRLWPSWTWSEVLQFGLTLAVQAAQESHDDNPLDLAAVASRLLADPEIHDELTAKMASAFGPAT